jgi:hypothetical protein
MIVLRRGQMSKKRKLDREGLEVYLLNLLMAYRPLLFVCGIFLLFYAIGMLSRSFLIGLVTFLPPMFLLLLCFSYQLTLATAKFGAWLLNLLPRKI